MKKIKLLLVLMLILVSSIRSQDVGIYVVDRLVKITPYSEEDIDLDDVIMEVYTDKIEILESRNGMTNTFSLSYDPNDRELEIMGEYEDIKVEGSYWKIPKVYAYSYPTRYNTRISFNYEVLFSEKNKYIIVMRAVHFAIGDIQFIYLVTRIPSGCKRLD